MNLSGFYPGVKTERVCIHKFAFTTARTISFSAGSGENTASYFSRNDVRMLSKYSLLAAHHALIRRIVLFSHETVLSAPVIIISIVSEQCLLYGMMMSGNSWCMARQPLQRKRRIINFMSFPSLTLHPRFRVPITITISSHTGHTTIS
jgi:hypothetical protein